MKSNFSFTVFLIFLLFSTLVEAQWFKQSNGLPQEWNLGWAIDASDSNNVIISIGTNSGSQIFKTTNGGDLWFEVQLPDTLNEPIIDISMPEPSHIWVTTDIGKIIASTDGGQSWVVQFDDTSKTDFMNYVEMFDTQNGVAMGDVYAGNPTYNPGPALFLRTTDGGLNWVSVNDSAFGGISGDTWRRLDFSDPMHGYFYESGINPQKIFKTTDGCNTWSEAGFSGSVTVLKCFNENIVLVHSVYNAKIGRTTDGGNTWRYTQFSGGWGNDFEFIPDEANSVFFTDGDNLFFSSDTGRTWTTVYVDTGALNGRDIVFTDDDHGWILGDSGTLYKTNVGGVIVNVNELTTKIPAEFSLSQNYPNPFNPSTTINYTIPNVTQSASSRAESRDEGSRVVLKVYDVLGNEVAKLVDEYKPAGNYKVTFDASKFASGIYFYQLTAGDYLQTKKMVLIK